MDSYISWLKVDISAHVPKEVVYMVNTIGGNFNLNGTIYNMQILPTPCCCAYHMLTEDMSMPCAGTPSRFEAPLPKEYVKA